MGHYPEAQAYIFGERVTARAKDTSAIDLAIDIGQKIELSELVRMKKTIENLRLPVDVGLFDLKNMAPDFRQYVLSEMVP